jgi:aspartate/methionine/tyrosine aminotransferase
MTERWSRAALRGVDRERAAATAVAPAADLAALHMGDPCFPTPEPIAQAAADAVRQGFTHYPPVLGDPELRTGIAHQLSARSGRTFTADHVVVTVGATGALASVLGAYLDEGDEALILDPTYSAYAPLIRQAGATVVRVPLRPPDFGLDAGALERAASPRTKLLVLANPANPTGVVLSRGELAAIADFVVAHDILLIVDEVYDRITFDGTTFHSALEHPELEDRLLYINSFSKTYAMTGWRVGYVAAAPDLLAAPATLARNAVNGVSWPAQRAALAALDAHDDVAAMVRGYAERRAALLDAVRAIGEVELAAPRGAFYVFVRFARTNGRPSHGLTRDLLRAGVAVRSGSEFGPAGEGFLRLSYSADLDDIARGAERLAGVVNGS